MAVINRREHRQTERYEFFRYTIEGVIYRVQITCYDYKYTEGCHLFAWSLNQGYHENTAYKVAGDLIYRGVSIKELWDEVESVLGEKTPIPEDLKKIQPFIANQT